VQAMDAETLETRFGRYGLRLYELSRGIDHSPVVPNRMRKSISAEDTFPEDIPLPETESAIRRLAEKVWAASRENARGARTVVLKLKTKEFSTLTRSLTPPEMPGSADGLAAVALSLFGRVELGANQLFRLVGVGLSNFQNSEEPPLFSGGDETSGGEALANPPVS
jgi:DNA polymerase-4